VAASQPPLTFAATNTMLRDLHHARLERVRRGDAPLLPVAHPYRTAAEFFPSPLKYEASARNTQMPASAAQSSSSPSLPFSSLSYLHSVGSSSWCSLPSNAVTSAPSFASSALRMDAPPPLNSLPRAGGPGHTNFDSPHGTNGQGVDMDDG
jgi:hypothetical protein